MQAPEEVVPFVNEHLDLDNTPPAATDGLVIEFVPELEHHSIKGRCERWSSGRMIIKLVKAYWDGCNSDARRVLIHHELGHCLRKYEHRGEERPDTVVTSLMWPYLLKTEHYVAYRKEYHKEMVTKKWEP